MFGSNRFNTRRFNQDLSDPVAITLNVAASFSASPSPELVGTVHLPIASNMSITTSNILSGNPNEINAVSSLSARGNGVFSAGILSISTTVVVSTHGNAILDGRSFSWTMDVEMSAIQNSFIFEWNDQSSANTIWTDQANPESVWTDAQKPQSSWVVVNQKKTNW